MASDGAAAIYQAAVNSYDAVTVTLAAWRRDDSIARVAFAIFVAGAIVALPTYFTDEGSDARSAVEHDMIIGRFAAAAAFIIARAIS